MGTDEIRQKLLGKFREVTADRIEKISGQLLELERGGGAEAKQEVARELHTLKGEARMMGFVGISQVVHAAEDLLRVLPVERPGDRVDALLRACDAIPALLDGSPDGGAPAQELAAQIRSLIRAPRPAEAPGASKVARETAPAGVPAEPVEPRAELRGDRPAASIRVDVDRLDEIAALAGDLLVEGARTLGRTHELSGLLARWNRISDRVVSVAEELRAGGSAKVAEQIEHDVHLLRSDTFRFLRGHVDAANSAQSQFARLADRVGAARLIPLSGILSGFPRAARDLAREQGKEVECVVHGGETGVDKAILLSLNDPLVHLLRNAVDHGLETPEERQKAGKPRCGRIVISARTDGDLLAVAVEDDGRGIEPNRIRVAALEKGIIGEAQAAGLSSRAALDLIFTPGFSTRAEAGELSGRGVGLDVVRKKVIGLGGSVAVESEPGRGARFVLRMPQSLSLMKVLLVRIDDDVYGIPAIDVEGVGRIESEQLVDVAGIRAVRHRGKLMPVVALGPLLSLNGGPRNPKPAAAFLAYGGERAAVVVDGLHGEREVAVKAPGAFLKGMRFVSGAAALEDGRVALLLSTPDLVAAARRLASPALSRGRDRRRLRILLVDDSAIAREAEAALLRSMGHEVEEAVDGEDGWQRLQSGDFQLLLTDVRMPVLDGIDFTRRVKNTARFSRLPVVILSSLSAPEERRRGLDAGADAYLVKGELEAETLAATMERLCGVAQ
jgi:two-component system chemotaxis sensor kinase CheA/two-component system sensor histidine kinase and response regulator WspE